jgi:hypothetical protein
MPHHVNANNITIPPWPATANPQPPVPVPKIIENPRQLTVVSKMMVAVKSQIVLDCQ